jgi:hypothetical protein
MVTPFDRMPEDDNAYKNWLLEDITVEEGRVQRTVERVVVRMHLYGYLKFAVAFAVTDRSAWCVLGKREFRKNSPNEAEKQIVSLLIERVEHVAVKRLWLGILHFSLLRMDP